MHSHSSTYLDTAAATLLERIGNTPLLEIRSIAAEVSPGVRILAKAEWYNPGGSVKDRAAYNIVSEAIARGELTHDRILIDATSGNTGIAYAMIGSALGYRVCVALPANASTERKRILNAYGAEVISTDPLEGTDGAQVYVRNLVARDPAKYYYADQYNNPANWQAHYRSTAVEIFSQTGGGVTHFVAGLGTTGTFVGTTRRLKELNPTIRCIAFQPDSPLHGLEGLKHLASATVPGIYDARLADDMLEISTEDAYAMVRRLAREQGLLVGFSGGASMVAALRIARSIDRGVIVTILPDHGTRYLSEMLWES